MSIASALDLSGNGARSYLLGNANGGTLRERLGEGLFTEDQKRIAAYRDQDIAKSSARSYRSLESFKADTVDRTQDDSFRSTGRGRNLTAKSVGEQFAPLSNNASFRMMSGRIAA